MSDLKAFEEGLKLVVLYQATLEQMDVMKGTNIYKQSIKKNMNRLEKDIEQIIRGPIAQLDEINSDLFTDIQQTVEMILDLSVTELAQLKVVIDDHREDQLQEWQQQILDKEIDEE
jgi:hypothetical protein